MVVDEIRCWKNGAISKAAGFYVRTKAEEKNPGPGAPSEEGAGGSRWETIRARTSREGKLFGSDRTNQAKSRANVANSKR